jgi:hypothetical protein
MVSRGDGAVELKVPEHALNAVSLAVEAFAVADYRCSVGFWRNDGFLAHLDIANRTKRRWTSSEHLLQLG